MMAPEVSELRCIQGCVAPLAAIDDDSGVTVYFCAMCRGTFCHGRDAARWLGSEASALPLRAGSAAARCPSDGGTLLFVAVSAGPPAFRCAVCSGLFVCSGAMPRVRSLLPPRTSLAPRARETPRPAPSERVRRASEAPLSGERLGFDDPWVNLLALPGALLLSALISLSTLGQLLLHPLQIQFHELGHAICAWLSSRAALPLPFGFTFWREDQSVFTGACMMFLIGVLGYRGLREQRKFAVALALVLLGLFSVLSLLVEKKTSLMLMLAGGIAGELTLSTLTMVAFFFPLPDRWRWDFFRFLLLLPAAGTWLAAVELWRGVTRGERALPMGSILGTPGDGSGDLDRLIADHHFTPDALANGYYALAGLTASVLVLTYGWFALCAVRDLRGRLHTPKG
jgi:hypothetical protein